MTPRRIAAALVLSAAAVWLVAVPSSASAAASGKTFGSRVLQMGSKGKDVRVLQQSLTTLGRTTAIDGFFGQPTKQSVKKLERTRGWKVDGRVDRKDAKRITKLVTKRTRPPSVFFLGGLTQPTVTVTASKRGTATVNVMDANTGLPVMSYALSYDGAGAQTVAWKGETSLGTWALDSEYRFELSASNDAAAALSGQTKPFSLRRHHFPVPGTHSYGGSGSRFGAGRAGHTHQGQDLAASCGEKLYATEAGTITTNAYQASGAGYYIVIQGAYTGTSHVYMHLQKPAWAPEGTVVYPGQQLGKVGTTGSSTGCHLHFERWTAPGWYLGGSPYDPLAELQAWDAYS